MSQSDLARLFTYKGTRGGRRHARRCGRDGQRAPWPVSRYRRSGSVSRFGSERADVLNGAQTCPPAEEYYPLPY